MKPIKNKNNFIYPKIGTILISKEDPTIQIIVEGLKKCELKCVYCYSDGICVISGGKGYCLAYGSRGMKKSDKKSPPYLWNYEK